MDETIYVKLMALFDFVLEVWFGIYISFRKPEKNSRFNQ